MAKQRKGISASKAREKRELAFLASVEIVAASGESSGPPRFDMVAYTGGDLRLPNFEHPVVVDLAGAQFHKSVKANLQHDRKQIVGHVTDKMNDGKQIRLGGYISGGGAAAREVIEAHKNNFPWEASIQANQLTLEFLPRGKTDTINAQQITGPKYIARKSMIYAVAFCDQGADADTTVTIAASAASTKENDMDPELKKWIEAMGFFVEDLTQDQIDGLKANYDGQQTPKKKSKASPVEDVIAAAREEDERKQGIAAICAQAIADNPDRDSDFTSKLESLAEQAIKANWTVDKFDTEVLRATRPQAHTVWSRRSDDRVNSKVIEAAICMTGGLVNIDKRFDEPTLESAHKHFPHGIGLKQLLCICAEANGFRGTLGGEVTLEVQRAAFGMHGQREIRASGFSTLSTPGILSATANKFLQQGWMAVDSTWSRIAARRSVRNFQTATTYSLTGAFQYDKVGAGGELKHGTVGEETYTNKADTYGKMFAITRTDIINDDLGALTTIPTRMGRGAALALNDIFWTEFLNNSSFFATGNVNVSTGAGSALGSADGAAINAAEVVFMNQTDPNGKPLGIMPAIMLVPPTLANTARRWMGSFGITQGGTSGLGDSNVFAGRYRVESSPYMENSSYTGNSTAAWYLLANPSDLAVIEVCFLNGKESPTVETADADFNVLGIQMRGYHDFGVNLQEPRAGVRSAGS